MGLLDFAANIGEKLFDTEAQAAEKIQERILANNPGVSSFNVVVEDGVASITCTAEDRAAAEKAILMVGNVRGVSQVKYEITSTQAAVPAVDQDATLPSAPDVTAVAEAAAETTEVAASPSELIIESELYEIQSGDSLSAIAKKFLGDGSKYQQIFEMNREVILDPDKIYPGQRIRIPQQ